MRKLVFVLITLALMMFVVIPVMADETFDLNDIQSIRPEYIYRINSKGQTMIVDDVRLFLATAIKCV